MILSIFFSFEGSVNEKIMDKQEIGEYTGKVKIKVILKPVEINGINRIYFELISFFTYNRSHYRTASSSSNSPLQVYLYLKEIQMYESR